MKKLILTGVLLCVPFCWALRQVANDPSQEPHVHLSDFTYLHSDNFRIYLENRSSLNEKTLELLETVYDRYVQLMLREGYILQNSNSFTWLCFNTRQAYEAYSRKADGFVPDRLNSYYSAKTNYVAVLTNEYDFFAADRANERLTDPQQISGSDFPAGADNTSQNDKGFARAMITHELIHQLSFNTGLQQRGVEYPLWVSEGMATAFEYLFDQNEKDNRYRLCTIIQVKEQNRLIPLDVFVSMSRLTCSSLTDSETYAQCWAFFAFLWEHRKPELRQYLSSASQRPVGPVSSTFLKGEFVDCFGALEPLESDWNLWLAGRKQTN